MSTLCANESREHPNAPANGRMAPKVALQDPVLGPLTDDLLTRDVRVYQRAKGHRFSSDDVATAYVAFKARPSARRVLDLGCGLGSVLLHLAWKLPEAELTGVEAQAMSFELLKRNVARSGFAERVQIHHGDLRDTALLSSFGGGFELVTGTPPYFPRGTGTESAKTHAAAARFEHRGGVEDYLAVAAQRVAPGGRIAICSAALERDRVATTVRALDLGHLEHWAIVPRAGKQALVMVDVLVPSPVAAPACHELVVRDLDGRWTSAFQEVRAALGMPSTPPRA